MSIEQVVEQVAGISGKRLARALTVAGIVWARFHDGRRAAYVPSASTPGGFYKVTAAGCCCVGYQRRGWCRHSDAVMLRLAARQGKGKGAAVPSPVIRFPTTVPMVREVAA